MLTNTQRINRFVRERLNQSGRPDTPVGIFFVLQIPGKTEQRGQVLTLHLFGEL